MLEYNVLKINKGTGEFELYNIFDHYRFLQRISRLLGQYDRREKEDLSDLKLFEEDELVTKKEIKKTKELWDIKRLENFNTDVEKIINYYFLQKCKDFLFLGKWPNTISIEELTRLNSVWDSYSDKKREIINLLDVNSSGNNLKIAVYDQICLNWGLFISYLQQNKKEIRLLAKEEKEKHKQLNLQEQLNN